MVADVLRGHRSARQRELLRPFVELGVERPRGQQVTWIGDLQQGDGGKGAMTDRLAAVHQFVVRVQGGDNAGHTTVFTHGHGYDIVVRNHLLPSGLRYPSRIGIIGNGVMVNAERLAEELDSFAAHTPDIGQRVFISDRAHLVLPLHRTVDAAQERRKQHRSTAIGTTLRGIGPASVSKINRIGVRVRDLRDQDLVRDKVADNVEFFRLSRRHVEENLAWLERHRNLLLGRVIDSMRVVNAAVDDGYSVLFEGAQGPLIDIEHGIYPYVTTSPTAFYSVASGSGVDPSKVTRRIGVLKAYQTMVGNGAFVSEDQGELGQRLRLVGAEYGATTGRPRRCGWLDLVHARWAVELNCYTSVVLTKLDVLDGFETIGVCVAYERNDGIHLGFLPEQDFLADCRPVYRHFAGWLCSTKGLTSYEGLPAAARVFVDFIADYLDVPISAVSKGPRPEDMLVFPDGELGEMLAG